MKFLPSILSLFLCSSFSHLACAALPSIFCCGDSTCKNSGIGADGVQQLQGWGTPIGTNATGWTALFDSTKCTVKNVGHGGTSAESYYTGDWSTAGTGVLAQIQPGDYVILVFGINTDPLSGNADTTNAAGDHSYGWYMRQMAIEARNKGAHPYFLTLTVRVLWTNPKATFDDVGNILTQQAGYVTTSDRLDRTNSHVGYQKQAATQINVPCFDMDVYQADYYETIGRTTTAPLYSDHNHTYVTGAQLLSKVVCAGLKAFKDSPFVPLLSAAGKAVPTADPKYIYMNLAVPARDNFITPQRP